MQSEDKKNFYNLNSYFLPTISEVGGKGFSLIKMTKAGLKVPPGFILTVNYFQTWTDELKLTNNWKDFINFSTEEEKMIHLNRLKNLCSDLEFSNLQESELNIAMNELSNFTLYAVRSSSPEEDLEGASFAGAYETVLGVTNETLKTSIIRAYASCLDQRIYEYKLGKGKPIIKII